VSLKPSDQEFVDAAAETFGGQTAYVLAMLLQKKTRPKPPAVKREKTR
jgi:hypothetical protein